MIVVAAHGEGRVVPRPVDRHVRIGPVVHDVAEHDDRVRGLADRIERTGVGVEVADDEESHVPDGRR